MTLVDYKDVKLHNKEMLICKALLILVQSDYKYYEINCLSIQPYILLTGIRVILKVFFCSNRRHEVWYLLPVLIFSYQGIFFNRIE
jgi:hypothetical protein